MVKKPVLFEYTEYRTYLADWMVWKSATGPYSKRWFARQAGLKAPNAWQMVVGGSRNLSPKSIPKFTGALVLTDSEARYFEDLVLMNQAKAGKDRLLYYQRLVRHPARRKTHPREEHHLEIFRHWLGPVLHEMLSLPDFSPDPAWIGKQLRKDLSVPEIKRVLSDLKAAGLVREEGRKWVSANPQIDTGDDAADAHFHFYHERALEQAADALEELGPDERYFVVVTSAVPTSALPGLRAIAQRFEEEVLRYVETRQDEKDQVVQIGFQLFPVLVHKKQKPSSNLRSKK